MPQLQSLPDAAQDQAQSCRLPASQAMPLWEKKHICSQAFFLSLSSNQNLISFPVPLHCRQCLCSFYYLSCCGKGNSAPLVNHASLRNISSSRLFLLLLASRPTLQEERQIPLASHRRMPFSPIPICPFQILMAGTAVVRVDAAPFVGGWGRCHLEPSSQRDGWGHR